MTSLSLKAHFLLNSLPGDKWPLFTHLLSIYFVLHIESKGVLGNKTDKYPQLLWSLHSSAGRQMFNKLKNILCVRSAMGED